MNKKETNFPAESGYIVGRNAVLEALRSGRELDFVTVQKGELHGSISQILASSSTINILFFILTPTFPYILPHFTEKCIKKI